MKADSDDEWVDKIRYDVEWGLGLMDFDEETEGPFLYFF